jgi:hypothetical protein
MLYRPDNGKFDWKMFALLLLGAAHQAAIILTIILNFKLAHQAGLNIGIAQAIWSINPFFQALIDKFLHQDDILCYHWLGMSGLIFCAVIISLSPVILPEYDESEQLVVHETPMYVAVLSNFILPVIGISMGLVAKKALVTYKADPNAFSLGYFLIMSVVFQVIGLVHFMNNAGSFNLSHWVAGFFGSAINALGCIFINTSVSTGAPQGPIFALVMVSTLIITTYECVRL